MKKPKFRAYNKEENKMYYSDSPDNKDGDYSMFNMNNTQWNLGFGSHGTVYIGANESNGILMQYAEKTDKNNKQIFEGDIVKFDDGGIYKIKFCDSLSYDSGGALHSGFYPFDKFDDNDLIEFGYVDIDYYRNMNKCEIIGNIYQDKELLK